VEEVNSVPLQFPSILEIVDTTEAIEGFLPMLEMLVKQSGGGILVTREIVRKCMIQPE
jgi:hypothetical protein